MFYQLWIRLDHDPIPVAAVASTTHLDVPRTNMLSVIDVRAKLEARSHIKQLYISLASS